MQDENTTFAAIDLKSFYASVECVERKLDAMDTLLTVADASRTEKTICLAVSPALKALGIPGRPRLFEVVQRVQVANAARLREYRRMVHDPEAEFVGESYSAAMLAAHPELGIAYITAPPRMARYMAYSTRIYQFYLTYVAPESIQAYSIDEVFVDLTSYLSFYQCTARELVRRMIQTVLDETGITATAGIGTNLYLAKVAMDIVAKHIPPDQDGVRIAELDQVRYRELLWAHRPLTDFWRVGPGIAKKLEQNGLRTMGDVARCSIGRPNEGLNEDFLYRLFGVNAELLIDHAWGWEPCTLAQIKAYQPENNSLGAGQVLHCPYEADKARLIVREMIDLLALELVDKGLVTDQLVLTVGYDVENLSDPARRKAYRGAVTTDHYGRRVPKAAHGSTNLGRLTSSTKHLTDAMMELFDRIVDPQLLVRRVTISANHVVAESSVQHEEPAFEQLDLFGDAENAAAQQKVEEERAAREKKMQQAVLSIQKKFGKNAILKGMNLEEGGTTIARNGQVGGHKA